MKFKEFFNIETAAHQSGNEVGRIGAAIIFVVLVMMYTGTAFAKVDQGYILVAAAVIGAYMAMNIGANDVANNVGPAVGSFALTLTGAIVIAAVFEAGGAIIAGGAVVNTVKNGIIDPANISDPNIFVWVMMGALLGAAIWLNVATWLGAPVSTTHSIVGGVMGGGIAASGWDIVNWESMGSIAFSWVVSPIAGGIIAALFLLILNKTVFFRDKPREAAKVVVPLMISLMAWAFGTYLALKGIKQVIKVSFPQALIIGLVAAVLTYLVVRPAIARAVKTVKADREGISQLFTIPLIFAAALLSFAHGANDVANAVGPLAGIVEVITHGGAGAGADKVGIPLWVMAIGALGISVGLALFGPRLIRTVGSEITELDRSRAFCIALSAALTVIVASQLGLPISSTHVALGAVFGIGFLREYLDTRLNKVVADVLEHHRDDKNFAKVEEVLRNFQNALPEDKKRILRELRATSRNSKKKGLLDEDERKQLHKSLKRQLVRRSALLKIASAWVITVPVAGLLSAMFFFMLRGMLLP